MSPPEVTNRIACELRIRGTVQGVGFRPFIYRLARELSLRGWVRNDGYGVAVHIEGRPDRVVAFQDRIQLEVPEPARLEDLKANSAPLTDAEEFRIEFSTHEPTVLARVLPDQSTCAACLAELFDETNRRFRHPFLNCTRCGPRYTIIEGLPYDRVRSSMRHFPLCSNCNREVADPDDRRFHAQPVACPDCGPTLSAQSVGEAITWNDLALSQATGVLKSGGIVAVKGLGGFQLLVRADEPSAVRRLRDHKQRGSKPFAVMVASLNEAQQLASVSAAEHVLLASAANPIVLLQRLPTARIAAEVAPHVRTIGLFLPTTPLHHLLLADLGRPVVATSGNRSGEPIALNSEEANNQLAEIADCVLDHNRPIHRRADDSVVCIVSGRPMTVRLARGEAPLPLPHLEQWAAPRQLPPVLALGGQQKVSLALWTGSQAVLGPHIGDLDHVDTLRAFEKATHEFADLYSCAPVSMACDSHPDYASTRLAESSGLEVHRILHHHAHAVATMVEQDLLNQEVLAFTWDGTGLGADGTLWGGEVLRVTQTASTRVASLRPIPLVGGESAIYEPARIALVLVAATIGESQVLDDRILLDRLGLTAPAAKTLIQMSRKGINCPHSTATGRLIDGLAALVLGLPRITYEAEAAIRLEALVIDTPVSPYRIRTIVSNGIWQGDWRSLVQGVLNDLKSHVTLEEISTKIHRTLVQWATDVAIRSPDLPIVLGGGCFQNRCLTEWILEDFNQAGRVVHRPQRIPANDGGLSVGQLAIAMARLAARQSNRSKGEVKCVWESQGESLVRSPSGMDCQ